MVLKTISEAKNRKLYFNAFLQDIYSENPDVRWDDIIGLDHAKRLVKEAVVYPIKVSGTEVTANYQFVLCTGLFLIFLVVPTVVHWYSVTVEGLAAIRAAWHGQDFAGEGGCDRVRHDLLQHLSLQHRQQVARRLGKTRSGELLSSVMFFDNFHGLNVTIRVAAGAVRARSLPRAIDNLPRRARVVDESARLVRRRHVSHVFSTSSIR